MRYLFASIAGIVIISLLAFASKLKKQTGYLGQRCPPDMEFIAGDSSMPSFFMGKSQETNMNYAIYLNWLKNVYSDVGQISTDALPHDIDMGELNNYNDPSLKGQLNNPAFAYYPITGCDWQQIQNYLAWKTDRLNEDILVRTGYLKFVPGYTNSDVFNTEAKLAGQWYGFIKKKMPENQDLVSEGKISDDHMAHDYPFLFTGFRLPTEEEWEYASNERFLNKENTEGRNAYPFGKDYYVFHYADQWSFYPDYLRNKSHLKKEPFGQYIANGGTNESGDLNRVKGANTYNTKAYGVFNLGNNVEEWMMDAYSPAVKHYKTEESIYIENGFYVGNLSDFRNKKGLLAEKDSSGRMPYRIIGYRPNGSEIRVDRKRNPGSDKYVLEKVRNPDSLKIKDLQKKRVQMYMDELDDYERGRSNNYTVNNKYVTNPFIMYDWESRSRNPEFYKHAVVLDSMLMISNRFVNERDYIYVYKKLTSDELGTLYGYRVVKSGTWNHPSTTARRKMPENEGSANVGFRVVLPYYGMPIDKKDMVKW